LKIRKPALAAATLALAITPALTAVTPAQAAPSKAQVLAAAVVEELSLVEQVLAAFPPAMADIARQLLAGDFTRFFELFTEAMKLTPTQINTIIATLQTILGQFGGTEPPPATTPPPATEPAPVTDPAPVVTPASFNGGPVFKQVSAPGDTQDQKIAWVLDALLQDAGKKRNGQVVANILVNVALSAR
jgi:hypothetical protein